MGWVMSKSWLSEIIIVVYFQDGINHVTHSLTELNRDGAV